MKLAVISITNNGALLAETLVSKLGETVEVFAKEGRNPIATQRAFASLSSLVADIFTQYDGLVFIMAAGIVVRVIAPYITDKRFDPAVVVMDEQGEHAISLLSGHIGGANELAQQVAAAAGAKPVITTATDINNMPAADVLAIKLDLTIEPFERLIDINAAIVNGDRVAFFLDSALINNERYMAGARQQGVTLRDMDQLARSNIYDAAVIITDKELNMIKPHLYLRPRTISLGIGCRRGTNSSQILAAITDAMEKIGRSMQSIAVISSSVVKREEIGLLAISQQLAVPVVFLNNEELQQAIDEHQLTDSSFVKAQIGVGNVCEAAALLGGKADKLLLPKTNYQGITVAIAEVQYQ